jgi:GDP-4-dehydro-6-deoxy-D-mannose reductase
MSSGDLGNGGGHGRPGRRSTLCRRICHPHRDVLTPWPYSRLMEADRLMRVLITGVAGFVGRHLAAHLFAKGGHEIWGLVRPGRTLEECDAEVRLVHADLQDKDAVDAAVAQARPEAVYHLAGQASVAKSLDNPLDTLFNNVVGQVNLLEACARHVPATRILVVGSADEYGLIRPDDLPIKESHEFRPISPYAVSKVTQDVLGYQYFATRKLPIIRVRSFTHTGPGQDSTFVTPAFARQLAEMEQGQRAPTMKVGYLDGQRDFTDVRDVVRGYRLLIERATPGEAYNLGSGVPRTVRSVLDGLLALSTVRPTIETDQARIRPLEMPIMYADCSKIEAATGWTAQIPFEQTLQDVLDYWRDRVRAGV